jgi:hypothetical protein
MHPGKVGAKPNFGKFGAKTRLPALLDDQNGDNPAHYYRISA